MLTHEQILQFHDKAYLANQETREKAANDMQFAWVTQWDDETLNGSDLKYRGEFNIIRKAVRRVLADLSANEVQVDFEPEDDTSDDEADIMDGAYRAAMRSNSAQEAKKNANQECAVCGVGAWELTNEYRNPWDKKQTIVRRPIFEANNTVFWDPNARLLDKSDADYVSIITPYSEDAYKKLKKDLGKDDADDSNFSVPYQDISFRWYSTTKQVYVGKFYHREVVDVTKYTFVNMFGEEMVVDDTTIEENEDFLADNGYEVVSEEKSKRWKVTRYIVSGSEILEDTEVPCDYIPVVPQYGERQIIDGEECYEGLVRLAKDPQRLRNFQLSYLADITSRSPRKKPIFTDAQIDGYEDMYEETGADNALPYAKMNHYDANGEALPIGAIGYIDNPDVPPALAQSIVESRAAVDDVASAGLAPDMSEVDLSGKAIMQLQKRLDMQSYTYQDNHKYALRRDGLIFASMFTRIMDEEQDITVVRYDGSRNKERINQSRYDFERGKMVVERDVRRMKFGVYADIGPTWESVREQNREQLKELLADTPPGTPTYNMLLNKFLSMVSGAGFEDIRDYSNMQLVLMGVRKPETEEEIAAFEQQQQQAGQPDAQTQALLMEGQARMMEGQAALQNEQNDAAKIAIDQFNAETKREVDRQRLIIDAAKVGAELENKRADTASKLIENRLRVLGVR